MTATEDFIKVNSISDGNLNEYELKGLKSKRDYSIIIYGVNEYGVSPSNVIIVKT